MRAHSANALVNRSIGSEFSKRPLTAIITITSSLFMLQPNKRPTAVTSQALAETRVYLEVAIRGLLRLLQYPHHQYWAHEHRMSQLTFTESQTTSSPVLHLGLSELLKVPLALLQELR